MVSIYQCTRSISLMMCMHAISMHVMWITSSRFAIVKGCLAALHSSLTLLDHAHSACSGQLYKTIQLKLQRRGAEGVSERGGTEQGGKRQAGS